MITWRFGRSAPIRRLRPVSIFSRVAADRTAPDGFRRSGFAHRAAGGWCTITRPDELHVMVGSPLSGGNQMKPVKSKLSAVLMLAFIAMTACGSDSTGPSSLDAASALRSLSLGLQLYGKNGSTATLDTDAAFGGIAPLLNQVTVNIDGSSQLMFGLALHETFPQGTCWEAIFTNVVPSDPNVCTPPPLALAVMAWQSHSASEKADRMALRAGDAGNRHFGVN